MANTIFSELLKDPEASPVRGPAAADEMLARAAGNISKVTVATAAQVDVYLLLAHRTVVVSRDGLELLTTRLRRKSEGTA